ncbi:MAG: hypothetical protein ACRED8_05290, partial [Caulobacteraceae bacterium]
AYAAVQAAAMKARAGEGGFLDLLKADSRISSRLSAGALAELFDPAWHFRRVDEIFARVFGGEGRQSSLPRVSVGRVASRRA